MIEGISKYFASLPPTLQAAIIASLVTVVGIIFAAAAAFFSSYILHRGNERRFAKQLEHDRTKSRVDREMDLRKQVYLDATEAVDVGIGMIQRYANIRVNQEDLSKEYSAKVSAISKVHLIAQDETLKAVLKFTRELNASIIKLAFHRQPLVDTYTRINMLGEQINMFSKERNRMVELMKQLSFEGNKDQHRWKFIQDALEFEQKMIVDTTEQQKKLSEKLKIDWANFVAECYAISVQIRELVIPAVKAVREELELPFDYEHYKLTMEESIHSQDKLLKEYLDQILKSAS